MAILFGIFLFIGFISLMVFGAYYFSIRNILEENTIEVSIFFNWIIPDFLKFKELIRYENNPDKKREYEMMLQWATYSFIILVFSLIIAFGIFLPA